MSAEQQHSESENENRDENGSQGGQMRDSSQAPLLFWDQGTAYDLFISLQVLHSPEDFGLRASWAAGVRSRLSAEDRKTLENAKSVIKVPFHWIYKLPEPKDATSLLWALRQLPAEQRLPTLGCYPDTSPDVVKVLQDVARQQAWGESDLETLKNAYRKDEHQVRPKTLIDSLNIWAQSVEFGERYLEALQSYHQAFFAEEEQHIASDLKNGLAQAQALAERVSFPELIEQLSQGVRISDLFTEPELVLVPSYWSTPLIFWGKVSTNRSIMIFGARPADASLVPGEVVPDALLRVLKAMADPTRLRILRYLAHESLTPSELTRRLRLRAPTVTHHLNALRLAGLVHLDLERHAERRYAARLEAIEGMCDQVEEFLESDQDE